MIGLSGKAQGTVVLGLSREAALSATEVLLQERPAEINGDVTDAVGELVNIIAGSAKAKLEHLDMSVSLPTVITGKFHCVEFPTKVTPICIPFNVRLGRDHRGSRALRTEHCARPPPHERVDAAASDSAAERLGITTGSR